MTKYYPYKDKEWLIDKINKYGYIKNIVRETGFPETSIARYIGKHDLRSLLRKPTHEELAHKPDYEKYPYMDKNWLEDKISKFGYAKEISRQTGYPLTSVVRYIHKYNLVTSEPPIYRTTTINENYFSVIDTEEKAYFLGLMIADGNVMNQNFKYSICIALQCNDMYLNRLFLGALGSNSNVTVNQRNISCAKVWCKKMFYDLEKVHIVPRKTGKETIPDIPKELMHHYLRGFFDGDGTIYKRTRKRHKCAIGVVCQNKKFIEDINNILLAEIGESIGTIFYKENRHCYECKTESYEKSKKIAEWLYKDAHISMIRKFNKAKELLNIECPSMEQFIEEIELNAGTSLEPLVLNYERKNIAAQDNACGIETI